MMKAEDQKNEGSPMSQLIHMRTDNRGILTTLYYSESAPCFDYKTSPNRFIWWRCGPQLMCHCFREGRNFRGRFYWRIYVTMIWSFRIIPCPPSPFSPFPSLFPGHHRPKVWAKKKILSLKCSPWILIETTKTVPNRFSLFCRSHSHLPHHMDKIRLLNS